MDAGLQEWEEPAAMRRFLPVFAVSPLSQEKGKEEDATLRCDLKGGTERERKPVTAGRVSTEGGRDEAGAPGTCYFLRGRARCSHQPLGYSNWRVRFKPKASFILLTKRCARCSCLCFSEGKRLVKSS